MPDYEVIKDPIHGYIKVFKHELDIIDTPIFQRLRRIKQNPGVDFVYPCATHTRFSHSLGVMHVASLFTERILDQIKGISDETRMNYYYKMRLWGLTHDIGHGPFSHLFDDVILSDYDTDHEKIGAEILRNNASIPQILSIDDLEINLGDIANLLEVKTIEDWPMTDPIGESNINEKIFFYIGHGAYSADLLDYILRDSYFTGAGYGNIDWQRLVNASIPHEEEICLDIRAEEAFDALLISRLAMFSTVYYHRTTRAAARVAQHFLEEAKSSLGFEEFVNDVNQYAMLDEDFLLFHNQLNNSEYGKCLKQRNIPYGCVREVSVKIEDAETSGFFEEDVLTQGIRVRLPQNLQQLETKAYFVDTPKIRTNPLLGNDYISIHNPKRLIPIYSRPVKRTNWGTLTNEMSIIRLYIHDDFRMHEENIAQAFPVGASHQQATTHL